MWQLIKYFS